MCLAVEGVTVSGMHGAATLLHHHLPHFADNCHQVKIIAPPHEAVATDARCRIHIQRQFEIVTVVT